MEKEHLQWCYELAPQEPTGGHGEDPGCCRWRAAGAAEQAALKSSLPEELSTEGTQHLWAWCWMGTCA